MFSRIIDKIYDTRRKEKKENKTKYILIFRMKTVFRFWICREIYQEKKREIIETLKNKLSFFIHLLLIFYIGILRFVNSFVYIKQKKKKKINSSGNP